MKKFFYLSIVIFALASCKKNAYDVTPTETKTPDTIVVKTGSDANSDVQVPNANQFTSINLNIPDQKLTVKLNGAELTMVYDEDVVLLTQTASLKKSYAVHFTEDFSTSDLENFDYHSLTREGVNAFNWVDDNLNNINTVRKDTVLNNIAITKIEVARTFNFTHTFDNADAALAAYNKLITDKTQTISFSAYYAPADPNTATIIGKANLVFEAGN
jgi:hypothetical protein